MNKFKVGDKVILLDKYYPRKVHKITGRYKNKYIIGDYSRSIHYEWELVPLNSLTKVLYL